MPALDALLRLGPLRRRELVLDRRRELPACGYLINGHASLLPRHRGAAPIAHAILAGDTETGVSVMRVEKEMDAGPVALMRSLEIGAEEDLSLIHI